MDLILEVRNKDRDKIRIPYGNKFQCLGGCFVTKVCISVSEIVDKVLNTITVIMD